MVYLMPSANDFPVLFFNSSLSNSLMIFCYFIYFVIVHILVTQGFFFHLEIHIFLPFDQTSGSHPITKYPTLHKC
jgi:hypothetical protein